MRNKLEQLARKCGFTNMGFFPVEKIEFREEVRDMCSSNRCGKYGKRWTCPPALPKLHVIAGEVKRYGWGILLQSTGHMEDPFDGETMFETEILQRERFDRFHKALMGEVDDVLPMSSSGCSLCTSCTYPEEPCRHPNIAVPSMEAYGLLVTDVCKLANIPYYYGKNTITFTACVLFSET